MSEQFPRKTLPSGVVAVDSLERHINSTDPHPGVFIKRLDNKLCLDHPTLYKTITEFRSVPALTADGYDPRLVFFTGDSGVDEVTGLSYQYLHPYIYAGAKKVVGDKEYPVWVDKVDSFGGVSKEEMKDLIYIHATDADTTISNVHPTLARKEHTHDASEIENISTVIDSTCKGKFIFIVHSQAELEASKIDQLVITNANVAPIEWKSGSYIRQGRFYRYDANDLTWTDITASTDTYSKLEIDQMVIKHNANESPFSHSELASAVHTHPAEDISGLDAAITSKIGSSIDTKIATHNNDPAAHFNTYEAKGTAAALVTTHNTDANSHAGVLAKAEHTHDTTDITNITTVISTATTAAVTAHNNSDTAHNGKFDSSGTASSLLSSHNTNANAHAGTFDVSGTATATVTAHNNNASAHDGILAKVVHTHNVADVTDFTASAASVASTVVSTHNTDSMAHSNTFEAKGTAASLIATHNTNASAHNGLFDSNGAATAAVAAHNTASNVHAGLFDASGAATAAVTAHNANASAHADTLAKKSHTHLATDITNLSSTIAVKIEEHNDDENAHSGVFSVVGHTHTYYEINDLQTPISGAINVHNESTSAHAGLFDSNGAAGAAVDAHNNVASAHNGILAKVVHSHAITDITGFTASVNALANTLVNTHNGNANAHAGVFDSKGTAATAVTAHNTNASAHNGVLAPKVHTHDSTDITDFSDAVNAKVDTKIATHNSDSTAHAGKFDSSGAATAAVAAHNTAANAHTGMFASATHTHSAANITDLSTTIDAKITTHNTNAAAHSNLFDSKGTATSLIASHNSASNAHSGVFASATHSHNYTDVINLQTPISGEIEKHNSASTAHAGLFDASGTANSLIATHNANASAHSNLFDSKGAATAAIATHNTAANAHNGLFDAAGAAATAVSTHNTNVSAHAGMFAKSAHTHVAADITNISSTIKDQINTHDYAANAHQGFLATVDHNHSTADITDFDTEVDSKIYIHNTDASAHYSQFASYVHSHAATEVRDFDSAASNVVNGIIATHNDDVNAHAGVLARENHSHYAEDIKDIRSYVGELIETHNESPVAHVDLMDSKISDHNADTDAHTGKFAAASHTHSAASITDLTTTIDTKITTHNTNASAHSNLFDTKGTAASAISVHNNDSTAHAGVFASKSHTHSAANITDFTVSATSIANTVISTHNTNVSAHAGLFAAASHTHVAANITDFTTSVSSVAAPLITTHNSDANAHAGVFAKTTHTHSAASITDLDDVVDSSVDSKIAIHNTNITAHAGLFDASGAAATAVATHNTASNAHAGMFAAATHSHSYRNIDDLQTPINTAVSNHNESTSAHAGLFDSNGAAGAAVAAHNAATGVHAGLFASATHTHSAASITDLGTTIDTKINTHNTNVNAHTTLFSYKENVGVASTLVAAHNAAASAHSGVFAPYSTVSSHIADDIIHVTSEDRDRWDSGTGSGGGIPGSGCVTGKHAIAVLDYTDSGDPDSYVLTLFPQPILDESVIMIATTNPNYKDLAGTYLQIDYTKTGTNRKYKKLPSTSTTLSGTESSIILSYSSSKWTISGGTYSTKPTLAQTSPVSTSSWLSGSTSIDFKSYFGYHDPSNNGLQEYSSGSEIVVNLGWTHYYPSDDMSPTGSSMITRCTLNGVNTSTNKVTVSNSLYSSNSTVIPYVGSNTQIGVDKASGIYSSSARCMVWSGAASNKLLYAGKVVYTKNNVSSTDLSSNDVAINTISKISAGASAALDKVYFTSAVTGATNNTNIVVYYGLPRTYIAIEDTTNPNHDLSQGEYQITTGHCGIGLGACNVATGYCTFVTGELNVVGGAFNIVGGYNNTTTGSTSIVLGLENITTDTLNIAIGYGNRLMRQQQIAIGNNNMCSNSNTLAIGNSNYVYSTGSFAFGNSNFLSGTEGAYAFGSSNFVYTTSFAFGTGNNSSGTDSYTFGNYNVIATGSLESFVFGGSISVSGSSVYSFGINNVIHGSNAFVLGSSNTVGVYGNTYSINAYVVGNYANIETTFKSYAEYRNAFVVWGGESSDNDKAFVVHTFKAKFNNDYNMYTTAGTSHTFSDSNEYFVRPNESISNVYRKVTLYNIGDSITRGTIYELSGGTYSQTSDATFQSNKKYYTTTVISSTNYYIEAKLIGSYVSGSTGTYYILDRSSDVDESGHKQYIPAVGFRTEYKGQMSAMTDVVELPYGTSSIEYEIDFERFSRVKFSTTNSNISITLTAKKDDTSALDSYDNGTSYIDGDRCEIIIPEVCDELSLPSEWHVSSDFDPYESGFRILEIEVVDGEIYLWCKYKSS